MIRFVVGEVEFEEVQAVVDGVDQAEPAGQDVHGADAAVSDALAAAAHFVMDVAGGEHGPVAFGSGAIGDAVEDIVTTLVEDSLVVLSGDVLRLHFGGLLGIVAVTRKPP